MNGLPHILVLTNQQLPHVYKPETTANDAEGFARGFNIHLVKDRLLVSETLARHSIDVIVVDKNYCDKLDVTSDYTHKILYINPIDLIGLLDGDFLFKYHIEMMLKPKENKLISVFTPTYNTGDIVIDTYNSLCAQTYKDWEWVVIDDSTNDYTFSLLNEISRNDYRVKVFKQSKRSGIIGYLKNKAASLCKGSILVELDHDDQLTENALQVIKDSFDLHPSAGYLYSDSVEYFKDRSSRTYGPHFGMDCGKYYQFMHRGREYTAATVPINSKTLRHNVGLPNHVRAWRSEFYHRIGGHNENLAIADDHELSVRCFLNGDIIHVKDVLYFQRVREDGENTTNTRNAEIQRTSRGMFNYYDKAIHDRIEAIGRKDLVWDSINNTSNLDMMIDTEENYAIEIQP